MAEIFDPSTIDNYFFHQIMEEYNLEPRERRKPKIERGASLDSPTLEDLVDVALLLIAHPDDEVIGPGGTAIRLAKAGKEIYILQFSDGETGSETKAGVEAYRTRRLNQAAMADLTMGVKQRVSLHIPTWDLTPWGKVERGAELYEATIAFIRYVQPDLILTQSRCDSEPAHYIVNQIVTASVYKARSTSFCQDHGEKWETPFAWEFETQDPFDDAELKPEIFVSFNKKQLGIKKEAMSAHVSEVKKLKDILKTIEERYEHWNGCEVYRKVKRRGGDYLPSSETKPLRL